MQNNSFSAKSLGQVILANPVGKTSHLLQLAGTSGKSHLRKRLFGAQRLPAEGPQTNAKQVIFGELAGASRFWQKSLAQVTFDPQTRAFVESRWDKWKKSLAQVTF